MKCPYCGKEAVLKDSSIIYGHSYGMVYICSDYPKCDAYVGVHKNSSRMIPLGRMANRELRERKKAVHSLLDPLWRNNLMSRKKAYSRLREGMDLDSDECHVGKFDEKACEKAMDVIAEIIKSLPEKVEESV